MTLTTHAFMHERKPAITHAVRQGGLQELQGNEQTTQPFMHECMVDYTNACIGSQSSAQAVGKAFSHA
jgi:hypothetical protein